MEPVAILYLFIVLKVIEFLLDRGLSALNRSYYLNKENQQRVCKTLDIASDQFDRTLEYTEDRYRFGLIAGIVQFFAFMLFVYFGGIGWMERVAFSIGELFGWSPENGVWIGLLFFGVMGVLSSLLSLPFDFYSTFKIEEKHGFNRQTVKLFFLDKIKGLVLGICLGAPLLGLLLFVMGWAGEYWWVWAWGVMSFFSILIPWIYPTFLAPVFNKFKPLEEGELKDRIDGLAERVSFRSAGLFVMDASKRTSHGNAYFTGLFGAKRIVLFDTLIEKMQPIEVEAVLAHELGHFKLHHVRWGLIQSLFLTGLMFFLLGLSLNMESFYQAFGLTGATGNGVSYYGALLVFSLWFGLLNFFIGPLQSWFSRRNEFAADAFARQHANAADLISALKKLRESSASMPICHPLYSMVHHSHPPLPERIRALELG